jgi:hypothetical protein
MTVKELKKELDLYEDENEEIKISLIVDTNKIDKDMQVGCKEGIYFVDANILDADIGGADGEPIIFAEDVNYDGYCCDEDNCHCEECFDKE